MNRENDLDRLFALRAEEQESYKSGETKEAEASEKKAKKLLRTDTKAGQERMGLIMDLAERENNFRTALAGVFEKYGLEADEEEKKRQLEGERRYLALPVATGPGQNADNFFLKALKPSHKSEEYERDMDAFQREVGATRFLSEQRVLPVLKVYEEQARPEADLQYSLMETLPDAEIGFIHNQEAMKKLDERHAKALVDQLFQLGKMKLPEDIDERIHDLQDPFENYEGYQENLWNLLDNQEEPECTQVRPLDGQRNDEGEIEGEVFLGVLARRFDMTGADFREKIKSLVSQYEETVKKYDGEDWVMTHGDLSPANVYVGDQDTRMLDWEWAGKTKNRLLAMVYDFGNLRARAFNNPRFQEALDEAIIEGFASEGDEEAGKAVVALGILRSHASLAGFFENYDPDVQMLPAEKERRELTESGLKKAFSVSGVEL